MSAQGFVEARQGICQGSELGIYPLVVRTRFLRLGPLAERRASDFSPQVGFGPLIACAETSPYKCCNCGDEAALPVDQSGRWPEIAIGKMSWMPAFKQYVPRRSVSAA